MTTQAALSDLAHLRTVEDLKPKQRLSWYVCGWVWTCVGVGGCGWTCVGVCGCVWTCVDVGGRCVWTMCGATTDVVG